MPRKLHLAVAVYGVGGPGQHGLWKDPRVPKDASIDINYYSHPDEVIAALQKEKVLPVATDLITQFNPAVPDHDAAIRALELIATEVAPALGWKPANDSSYLGQLTGA